LNPEPRTLNLYLQEDTDMQEKESANNFHPLEIKVLLHFKADETISLEAAIERLSFNSGQFNQSMAWLLLKHLIREKTIKQTHTYVLTELGKSYQIHGTPEEILFRFLCEKGPMTLPEISESLGAESSDMGAAYGALAKDSCASMDALNRVRLEKDRLPSRCMILRNLLNKLASQEELSNDDITGEELIVLQSESRKRGSSRGMFRMIERETKTYELSSQGDQVRSMLIQQGVTGDEIGQVTPEMLKTSSWKGKHFRPYNTNIPPQRVLLGRKNAYGEFLDELKDKLISFGFEEFEGPLIEPEFWNADALFMPQFHSARDIHDVYYIKDPEYAVSLPEPYLSQVALTHENGWKTGSSGWGYAFDKKRTHRLVLRSQGTVISAKTLTHAKIPGKYFGVVRCFRYDQTDATHLVDFYHAEGIVLGENVNLRTLLGLLKMFAVEVAKATEVKYVPAYFPFTEPSVEVHMKHPVLGWCELGGAGIFRPEVTLPLGISVPVIAWGLGVDRMAMMSLGLNDIRDLFTNNIEEVRLRRNNSCLK